MVTKSHYLQTFCFLIFFKGSPLCTILRYPFLVTDPKVFLKAPLAPIYTNIEGGARAEKNAVFQPVYSKLCLRRRSFGPNGLFKRFGRAWKINLVDLKKMSTKNSKIVIVTIFLSKKWSPCLDYNVILKSKENCMKRLPCSKNRYDEIIS